MDGSLKQRHFKNNGGEVTKMDVSVGKVLGVTHFENLFNEMLVLHLLPRPSKEIIKGDEKKSNREGCEFLSEPLKKYINFYK